MTQDYDIIIHVSKAVMRCYKALIEMRIIDEPVPEPMITDDVYLELIKMHQEKDF